MLPGKCIIALKRTRRHISHRIFQHMAIVFPVANPFSIVQRPDRAVRQKFHNITDFPVIKVELFRSLVKNNSHIL